MDNRSGLSNSAVNIVFQDKDQLVWVGTWDGLNMYDGTDFKVFNYNNDAQHGSIGNNVIQDIREDHDQNIWINTIGGITRFEKSTGNFYRYFYDGNSGNRIAEKEYAVATDSKGHVYCYSKTLGLQYFDQKQNTFLALPLSLAGKKIVKMEGGLNGMLWLLLNDGSLMAVRYVNGGVKVLKNIRKGYRFNNLFVSNQKIFAGGNNALYEINQQFEVIERLNNIGDIKSLTYYQSNYIIAWDSQGIGTYGKNFAPSYFMNNEVKQLSGTRVFSATSNDDKVLWLGTDGNGLIKIYPRINHFGLAGKATGYDLNKPVRAFCEENGNLWVATKGKGILKINNFWSVSRAINKKEIIGTNNGLQNNSVFALKKGMQDYVYIGTDGLGLDIYDLAKNKVIPWRAIEGTSLLPAFSSVYSILEDGDGSLWLGTSGSGLIHLNLKRDISGNLSVKFFKQYLSGDGTGPANDIIYALLDGGDHRLWIACRYGGLSVLDKQSGKFKTFRAFAYPNSLSNNDVLSLFQDKKKNLWIGTSYGLNKLTDLESKKDRPVFKKFIMADGLPNNTIHAIEEAGNGDVWLSTNKGLARLNAANLAIASFMESDGLQSNEFSDGAVWKSSNGYLFFGGIYGFNYFLPEKITGIIQQPNLLVSLLQMGRQTLNENQLRILSTNQVKIPTYILEKKSNFFQLGLKSMSYLNPEKNEFSYKLEGLDKNWNYSGVMGNVLYNNIPPGKYTMLVRWSNGEGIWTKGIEVFNLEVAQSFWLTYPALFFYILMVFVSGYAFHVYRKNKLQMHYKLAMEHMMREKDENEHQQRINFFTNIAHEIQTPLTLISGSIERVFYRNHPAGKESREYNFLSIVHQQSSRLTYLVNQLLDFRKAEAGYLKSQDSYLDISGLLSGIAELFVPLCDQKNLKYRIEVAPGIVGWMDKDKLEKIIFNLLSNAFKHSNQNQEIVFSVGYNPMEDALNVVVKNSGCQLSEAQLAQVFDLFYVANNNKSDKFYSNGIGLVFTRELVKLLKGSIEALNENQWISFIMKLPLFNALAEASEDNAESPLTHGPSYLLRSITANADNQARLSTKDNNKIALMTDLEEVERKSILIVEDEPAIRFLLKDLLDENYIIYEAENGKHAIDLLRVVVPNLIISDVMMPDIDGLELCNKVKNAPETCHIPFILLSARGSIEQKTEGYDAGADAYIPKPFDTMHLLVRVRKLIEYRQRLHDIFKKDGVAASLEEKNLADGDKQFLNKLVRIIEENMDDTELDAAFLESKLAMSKMQLYRKLKSLSNMTPGEFIRQTRLQKTIHFLQTTDLTVSEIFYRSGFNNQSYFFREFKKRYQCSPNEYRSQQKIHS